MSAAINDGGPAFPMESRNSTGLSMRDYFAAKALAGLLACAGDESYRDEALRNDDYPAYCLEYAESAYQMADAMLRAREQS